ncbi:MAG: hypothetical protein RLZZ153_1362, partial [Pseudomonadota bacterium]
TSDTLRTAYVDTGPAAGLGTNGVMAGQYVAVVAPGLIDPARDTGSALLRKLYYELVPFQCSVAEAVAVSVNGETHYQAAVSTVALQAGTANVYLFDGNGNIRQLTQTVTIADNSIPTITVVSGASASTDSSVNAIISADGVGSSYVYLVKSDSDAINGSGVLDLAALKASPTSTWNVAYVGATNQSISADGLAPGDYIAYLVDTGGNQAQAVNHVTITADSVANTDIDLAAELTSIRITRSLGQQSVGMTSGSLQLSAFDLSYTHSATSAVHGAHTDYYHQFSGEVRHDDPGVGPGSMISINLGWGGSNQVVYTVLVGDDYTWHLNTQTDDPISGAMPELNFRQMQNLTVTRGLEYAVVPTFTDQAAQTVNYTLTLTDTQGHLVTETGSYSYDLNLDALSVGQLNPKLDALTTNDTTPVLQGSAAAMSSFTVTVGGATYNVSANSNGRWTLDTGTATPQSGIFAVTGDSSAVNGTSVTVDFVANGVNTHGSFILDVSAPSAATFGVTTYVNSLPWASGHASFWNGPNAAATYWTGVDNTGSRIVTGTGHYGDSVAVTVGHWTGRTAVQADGTWAILMDAGALRLEAADGVATVDLTVTDQAGNTYTTQATAFTTGLPAYPTETTPLLPNGDQWAPDIPYLNAQYREGNAAPTHVGYINSASELQVTWGRVWSNLFNNQGGTVSYSVNGGEFNTYVSTSNLTDTERSQLHSGLNEIVIRRTEQAYEYGGAGNTDWFTMEYKAQVYLDTQFQTQDAIVNSLSSVGSDQTPLFSGYAEAFSTVRLQVGSASITTTADASGHWSLDLSSNIAIVDVATENLTPINTGNNVNGDTTLILDIKVHNLVLGDVLNVYGWGVEGDEANRVLLAQHLVDLGDQGLNELQLQVNTSGLSALGKVWLDTEVVHQGPTGASAVIDTSPPLLYQIL